jgi:hypothetical protein
MIDQKLTEAPFANIEDAAVKNQRITFCKTPARVRHHRQVHVQQRNVGRDKLVHVAYDRYLETHRLPPANHELDEIPARCDVVG